MSKRKNAAPPEQAAASAGQNIRDSAEPTAASTGKNPGAAPDKTLTALKSSTEQNHCSVAR
mgnify:CR=1 FL=1